jgi:hypothetical protein
LAARRSGSCAGSVVVMKVAYEAAFLRDLKRVRSEKVRRQVQRVIEEVKRASAPRVRSET